MSNEKSVGVDQPSLEGIDQLSSNDIVGSLFETADTDQQIADIKTGEIEKEIQKSEEDINIPDNIKKDEVVVDNKNNETDIEDEITIPGESKPEITNKENKEELADDADSWIPVAKELDLEIKENNFEEFKTAYKNKIELVREEAKLEFQTKSKEDIISSFPIDAQLLIKGLDAGLSKEQIEKPFQVIDEFLSMNDTDLVAKDLELEGMTPDMVERVVMQMSEDGKLDIEAFKIRKFLENQKGELKQRSLNDLEQIKQKNESRNRELLEKDTQQIHESLKEIPKLLESPIKDKHVNYVIEKWKKGEYQELFKNPKFVAQALLQHEFGEQASGKLATKKFEEGRSGIVNKLHNIPPIKTGPGGQSINNMTKEDAIGNFDFLKGINDDEL